MTNAKKAGQLRPYQARVEFLALKEEVERKRLAGHSVRAIYDELKNGGHLSMCYAAFLPLCPPPGRSHYAAGI
jgi:hypothetical protein